jgi:HAD superfamily phosphoserine phosphatase-like hydrolase
VKFIFDLDGTITKKETLPIISNYFNINEKISELTQETINGNIPFIESFIKRINILGNLPVSEINELLGNVPLSEKIFEFMQKNKEDCVIATGNVAVWIEKLVRKIGCQTFSSTGIIENNRIKKLTHILKKVDIVKKFKSEGEFVVFIGDGHNDTEAMRESDVSIACGLIHEPAKSVLSVCDYSIYDELALCRLLTQIKDKPTSGKSVILSCAGIGSRLGLSQTKALINIENSPLIHWQLDGFKSFEDIRIVVGFQAAEVIKTVLRKRRDIIFVYNHDYFHTKTGASFYLGSRHGNAYAIAWDGDLLVHPSDIPRCLEYNGQYVACSKIITDEAVFVKVDNVGNVNSFSITEGDFEWSGPACLKRDSIKNVDGHVYTQIEEHLPLPALIINAQDIDTYDDYEKAKKFIEDNYNLGNKNIDKYYSEMSKTINNPYATRNKAKDFSKYDIAFMKKFANHSKTLLDLGSGTGLLINSLETCFQKIVAVEKYQKFSTFINKSDKIEIINEDLLSFETDEQFDFISIFGVMNFFNYNEALSIYKKLINLLNNDGSLIIKNQMGVKEDVVINGYSEELKTNYYSEYRHIDKEIKLLKEIGFLFIDKYDIYPPEYNRWENTHFYALVCRKS